MHPRDQLQGTGITPKHSFGQNFLHDEHHQERIATLAVACARPRPGEKPQVVELGPGLGALTARLLERDVDVIAVERDRDLVPLLKKRFAANGSGASLTVVEDNAITWPLTPENGVRDGFALVGNLPYHHAADLCLRCVDSLPRIGGGCFLIQLEVGERIAASPGGKDYGVLSVLLQSRFDVTMPHRVPRGAFWPVPEVDGGVIVLRPLPADQVAHDVSFDDLRVTVRAAFQMRRKTLRNGLMALATSRGKDIDAVFDAAGIDPRTRAEQVGVQGFEALTRALAMGNLATKAAPPPAPPAVITAATSPAVVAMVMAAVAPAVAPAREPVAQQAPQQATKKAPKATTKKAAKAAKATPKKAAKATKVTPKKATKKAAKKAPKKAPKKATKKAAKATKKAPKTTTKTAPKKATKKAPKTATKKATKTTTKKAPKKATPKKAKKKAT
jgi:16S rRNA (adenine1518-N6/adenine1519-N6)-dimethyltransferase